MPNSDAMNHRAEQLRLKKKALDDREKSLDQRIEQLAKYEAGLIQMKRDAEAEKRRLAAFAAKQLLIVDRMKMADDTGKPPPQAFGQVAMNLRWELAHWMHTEVWQLHDVFRYALEDMCKAVAQHLRDTVNDALDEGQDITDTRITVTDDVGRFIKQKVVDQDWLDALPEDTTLGQPCKECGRV